MVAKKNSITLGMELSSQTRLFVLCGAHTTSAGLGFVNSDWDTGKSEFIRRRVTKMVETIPHGNWMKDLGIFILSENLFMKCYGERVTIMVF